MSIEDKIDDKRMQDDINFNSRSMQEKSLEQEGKRCHNGTVAIQGWCPEVWDKIFCWPSTAPGELAAQPCPRYIAGFDSLANATKQCTSNGEWYWNPQTNSSWTNYTQCYRTQLVTVLMDISGVFPNNDTLIEKYFPIVKSISKVGYTLSFFTLLIALCILVTIKKLRCPRNVLHMHTFASFTMRAFMALLKDTLFVSGIGLAFDIVVKNGDSYFFRDNTESNWHCKLFTTFWQYFILANYFWILMEGLYLHNLVFRALFTDATSNVTPYVALGWGLPTIFVAVWALSRAIFENTFCWTINSNPYLFLLIRLPTVLSILINFVLFVNIVRVLFSKLKCTVCEETQRYKRWAKSTLVLVPLFGVHYTLFLGMSYSMKVHEKIELVWLFCDQFFASFQVNLPCNLQYISAANQSFLLLTQMNFPYPQRPKGLLRSRSLLLSQSRGEGRALEESTHQQMPSFPFRLQSSCAFQQRVQLQRLKIGRTQEKADTLRTILAVFMSRSRSTSLYALDGEYTRYRNARNKSSEQQRLPPYR